MRKKLSILDRIAGRSVRIKVPLSKVSTVFGSNFNHGNHHISKTLVEYDRNPSIFYKETSLYKFLKNFSPNFLSDFIPGVQTQLDVFDFPWGELIADMRNKDRSQSRFCGPSTDEFIEKEFHRIINLYKEIKNSGYIPTKLPGGLSAGAFLINQEWDYRFIVLQGNHRAPILTHLGYSYLLVTLYPLYIRTLVFQNRLKYWVNVKNGKCSVKDAEKIFDFYFQFKP